MTLERRHVRVRGHGSTIADQVDRGIDQQLPAQRDAVLLQRPLRYAGREAAAGAVATDHDSRRVYAEPRGVRERPLQRRIAIVETRWKRMLRRQSILHEHHDAARLARIAHRVLEVPGRRLHHERSAVEVHQRGRRRSEVLGPDQPHRNAIAVRARCPRSRNDPLELAPVKHIHRGQQVLEGRQAPAAVRHLERRNGPKLRVDVQRRAAGIPNGRLSARHTRRR